jgi:hypothetical protein
MFHVEKSCWAKHLKSFCHTLFAPTAKSGTLNGDDDTLNGDDDTATLVPTPAPQADDDAAIPAPQKAKAKASQKALSAASRHSEDDDDLWAGKKGEKTHKGKKVPTVIMYWKGKQAQVSSAGHKNPDGSDDDEGNGSNQIHSAYFAPGK